MVKIVLDAGHGMHTPGKRSPDGEREWQFNDQVVRATAATLREYVNVQVKRVDDSTGQMDVPLSIRVQQANRWKADVYISVHHNAYLGQWGKWSGVETYTFKHPNANRESLLIAQAIHPPIVKAMGLADRGLRTENFYVLRETTMPAVLTEGGFMDSLLDIAVLRSKEKLEAQGRAIGEGLAAYFQLKKKEQQIQASNQCSKQ